MAWGNLYRTIGLYSVLAVQLLVNSGASILLANSQTQPAQTQPTLEETITVLGERGKKEYPYKVKKEFIVKSPDGYVGDLADIRKHMRVAVKKDGNWVEVADVEYQKNEHPYAVTIVVDTGKVSMEWLLRQNPNRYGVGDMILEITDRLRPDDMVRLISFGDNDAREHYGFTTSREFKSEILWRYMRSGDNEERLCRIANIMRLYLDSKNQEERTKLWGEFKENRYLYKDGKSKILGEKGTRSKQILDDAVAYVAGNPIESNTRPFINEALRNYLSTNLTPSDDFSNPNQALEMSLAGFLDLSRYNKGMILLTQEKFPDVSECRVIDLADLRKWGYLFIHTSIVNFPESSISTPRSFNDGYQVTSYAELKGPHETVSDENPPSRIAQNFFGQLANTYTATFSVPEGFIPSCGNIKLEYRVVPEEKNEDVVNTTECDNRPSLDAVLGFLNVILPIYRSLSAEERQKHQSVFDATILKCLKDLRWYENDTEAEKFVRDNFLGNQWSNVIRKEANKILN